MDMTKELLSAIYSNANLHKNRDLKQITYVKHGHLGTF
jgi:hypothetical protein